MTQIAQTPTQASIRVPGRAVAAIALAAALVGGILGSALQAMNRPATTGAPTVSAREQVVLTAAQDWEARYRQMYPTSR
jgi:hypothetical protein